MHNRAAAPYDNGSPQLRMDDEAGALRARSGDGGRVVQASISTTRGAAVGDGAGADAHERVDVADRPARTRRQNNSVDAPRNVRRGSRQERSCGKFRYRADCPCTYCRTRRSLAPCSRASRSPPGTVPTLSHLFSATITRMSGPCGAGFRGRPANFAGTSLSSPAHPVTSVLHADALRDVRCIGCESAPLQSPAAACFRSQSWPDTMLG